MLTILLGCQHCFRYLFGLKPADLSKGVSLEPTKCSKITFKIPKGIGVNQLIPVSFVELEATCQPKRSEILNKKRSADDPFRMSALFPLFPLVWPIDRPEGASIGWKTGFEPATSGTTIQRSNQLSYNHHL